MAHQLKISGTGILCSVLQRFVVCVEGSALIANDGDAGVGQVISHRLQSETWASCKVADFADDWSWLARCSIISVSSITSIVFKWTQSVLKHDFRVGTHLTKSVGCMAVEGHLILHCDLSHRRLLILWILKLCPHGWQTTVLIIYIDEMFRCADWVPEERTRVIRNIVCIESRIIREEAAKAILRFYLGIFPRGTVYMMHNRTCKNACWSSGLSLKRPKLC